MSPNRVNKNLLVGVQGRKEIYRYRRKPDSKMLIFVAAVLACAAAAAAPGGGDWNIEVGVNAITKGKGPVPGHYDMISTKVSGAGVWCGWRWYDS